MLVLLLALVALLAPAAARAQSLADTALYVVSNTTTLSVVTNRATVTTATIATLAFSTSALARDPVTRRIYYLSTNAATPLGRVAYYDPLTGTNTVLNATGNGDNVVRLTIAPDGTMYAIGEVASGSRLFTISKTTGAYTSLGSVRVGSAAGALFPDNGDLAFDPLTGVLYASATSTDGTGTSLYTINLATRVATEIGTITNASTQAALTFVLGTLYSGGGQGDLYTVNKLTGTGTLVVDNNFPWFDFTTGPPVADLQLSMTASALMTVGNNATWTLTAVNAGPYPATNVVSVVDTLPAGMTFFSAAGGGWTCSNLLQVVTCVRAAPVASGTTLLPITIVATITNAAAASVTNIAWVASSSMDDQNHSNNDAAVTSPITPRAVNVTPDGATITRLPTNGAQQYTQVFTVTNNGTANRRYNITTAVAPAGIVTIVSTSIAQTTNLVPGASASVTVTYTVAAGAATGASATITLTATPTTGTVITDTGDLTVTVAKAGIAMAKALYRDDKTTLVQATDRVSTGEFVQYKVTVTSSGSADAATVAVTDALPAQVTFNATSPDAAGWTITNTATSVSASLAGTLAAGQSRFFWIRVRVK